MKFGTAVMATVFIIFGTFTNAVGADWVSVYFRSGVNFYYDRESILNDSSGKMELDTRTVFETDAVKQKIIKERRDQGLSIEGWNKLRYIVNRIKIDCPLRKYTFLSGRHYDEGGTPLTSDNMPPVQWNPIVDSSPMMATYNAVCRALNR